ncbi:MAG: hypothetical protein AAGI51_00050 [Pseudomonadota bacterium]
MAGNSKCNGVFEPGDRKLEDLDLGPQVEALLDVMRFYFTSFAHPNSQAWIGALEWSVAATGPRLGPQVAYQAMRLVQALRGSRTTPFRFSSPNCESCRKIVTETERRLIMLVVHMQRGETSAAHAEAMLLCEGSNAGRLLVEADTLARSLQPEATPVPARAYH